MLIGERAPIQTDEIRDMGVENQGRLAEMNKLYERYGKPFEAEHWGEYIAISHDGRTLLGKTLYEAAERSSEAFGLGSFLFKIGERSVGKIR
jgi:hypothetical protein